MNPMDEDTAALAGLRVLLAEDEMVVAMSLEALLGTYDCRLATVASVSRAVALAQTEHFDGALLDINLGGEVAYPAAEALAKRDIPFIFLTGYSADQVEAQWRERPVLEKPFAPDELERTMLATFTAPRSP